MKKIVVFLGANTLIDNIGSSRFGRNAVAHKWFRNESEGSFFAAEFFPSVPITVAFEMGIENIFRTIFGDESYCGATDGIAEPKDRAFRITRFERFFKFSWQKKDALDFKIGIGIGFLSTTDFIIVSENYGGIRMFLISLNDFECIGMVVNVILVSYGDERSFTCMNSEIKVSADVCVFVGDYFYVIFFGEFFNMCVGGSGSNNNLRRICLVGDRFNTSFEVGT